MMQDANCDISLARTQLNCSKISLPRGKISLHTVTAQACTKHGMQVHFLGQLLVKPLPEESVHFVDFSPKIKFTAASLKLP